MIDRRGWKGVQPMLCLSLLPGEYVTIGKDVVLQYDHTIGERCQVVVNAPREVPILRGELLERNGGERPDCVFDRPRRYRRELPWNRSKAQALASIRALLDQMDSGDRNVQDLRRKLDHIFPPAQDLEQSVSSNPSVSPG